MRSARPDAAGRGWLGGPLARPGRPTVDGPAAWAKPAYRFNEAKGPSARQAPPSAFWPAGGRTFGPGGIPDSGRENPTTSFRPPSPTRRGRPTGFQTVGAAEWGRPASRAACAASLEKRRNSVPPASRLGKTHGLESQRSALRGGVYLQRTIVSGLEEGPGPCRSTGSETISPKAMQALFPPEPSHEIEFGRLEGGMGYVSARGPEPDKVRSPFTEGAGPVARPEGRIVRPPPPAGIESAFLTDVLGGIPLGNEVLHEERPERPRRQRDGPSGSWRRGWPCGDRADAEREPCPARDIPNRPRGAARASRGRPAGGNGRAQAPGRFMILGDFEKTRAEEIPSTTLKGEPEVAVPGSSGGTLEGRLGPTDEVRGSTSDDGGKGHAHPREGRFLAEKTVLRPPGADSRLPPPTPPRLPETAGSSARDSVRAADLYGFS